MAACTNLDDGLHLYPYGNTYAPGACKGKDLTPAGTVAVGTLAGCKGGVAGVSDMSGNVSEWIDACSGATGATDRCVAQGGSFNAGDLLLRCSGIYEPERRASECQLGFRCCAP
jgi:formylglycine-generating enzyme required for sulfatase activity